jgi:hypothetical protein
VSFAGLANAANVEAMACWFGNAASRYCDGQPTPVVALSALRVEIERHGSEPPHVNVGDSKGAYGDCV